MSDINIAICEIIHDQLSLVIHFGVNSYCYQEG